MKKVSFSSMMITAMLTVGCKPLGEIAQQGLYPVKFANKTVVPSPAPDEIHAEFLNVGEMTVLIWAYAPADLANAPVLIYFHGNGLNIGAIYESKMLEKMKTLGVNLVMLDYPSYGLSSGFASEENNVAAADITMEWVFQHFPNSRLIVWGQSLGGAIALQTTAKHQDKISKLIITQAWNELKSLLKFHFPKLEKFIPKTWKNANAYRSADFARQIQIPTLLHHGTEDEMIPYALGYQLYESFPAGMATWVPVPGRHHNDLLAEPSVWRDIQEFISVF
jgi:pimeloyl-ACP methyl ester carboxylesterase